MHFLVLSEQMVVRFHMIVPDSDPGDINKFSVLCHSCNASCFHFKEEKLVVNRWILSEFTEEMWFLMLICRTDASCIAASLACQLDHCTVDGHDLCSPIKSPIPVFTSA